MSPTPLIAENQDERHERIARHVVLSAGVPEATMRAADFHGARQHWTALAGAMDAMFTLRGGELGQRRFLSTPSRTLDGMSPVQMLMQPGGSSRVLNLVEHWVQQTCASER